MFAIRTPARLGVPVSMAVRCVSYVSHEQQHTIYSITWENSALDICNTCLIET